MSTRFRRVILSSCVIFAFLTLASPTYGILLISSSTNSSLPVRLYVTDIQSDTVTVLDGTTNRIITTIPVGVYPALAAFDPENGNVYVANVISNSISVISVMKDEVIKTFTGFEEPASITFARGNLWVGEDAATANDVAIVNPDSGNVITRVPVGRDPAYIAYSPISNEIYVANNGEPSVSVINASLPYNVVTKIFVGNYPVGVAYNPEDRNVFVAATNVFVITPKNVIKTIIASVPGPYAETYNGHNHDIYVTSAGSGSVSIINSTTYAVVRTVSAGSPQSCAAFNPVNYRIYLCEPGIAGLVQLKGGKLKNTINILSEPFDIAVS